MVVALKYSSAAPATHTQGQRAYGTLVACRFPRAIAAVLPCHVAAIQPCGSGAAAAGGSKVFRKISCQASSSAAGDSHAGHAFLHDFCMAIPYGAVALIAAALLAVMGAKQAAVPVAVGGFVVAGSAGLSLKNWRGSQPATPFTLVSAGASAYVAYTCWQSLQAGVIPWLSGIVLGLSAALSLFCIYNVLAGGNPPKRK